MDTQTRTAKEYLRQYEEATRKAQRLKTEYDRELELIDSVRSTLGGDGMPHGSGISRRVEDQAIRLSEKARDLKDAETAALDKRQQIFEVINSIEGIEGEVLYERYINLHRWEEICVLVHYSWNGVHKAHRRALAIVQEIIDSRV